MHPKTTIFVLISNFSLFPFLCSSSSGTFPACWGFGDIATDTGNNNFIPTYLRSNFRPYGRDFPNGIPTGRFNNGKLLIDFICSGLGLKNFTPPYLDTRLATDEELLTGATFGSGGSGLDPLTTRTFNALSMSDQIRSFQQALQRIKVSVGEEVSNLIAQKSLLVLITGIADFELFYDARIRSLQFNISGYQDFVLQRLKDVIQKIYNVGGRRFLVSNLPPIGCIPLQITLAGNIDYRHRECIQQQNDDSLAYNEKFQNSLLRLQQVLPNSTIIPYDFYNFTFDAVINPAKYGFEVSLLACCGTGLFEVGPTCREPFVRTCPDASKYVFWDSLNPTEAFYKILADVGIQAVRSRLPSSTIVHQISRNSPKNFLIKINRSIDL